MARRNPVLWRDELPILVERLDSTVLDGISLAQFQTSSFQSKGRLTSLNSSSVNGCMEAMLSIRFGTSRKAALFRMLRRRGIDALLKRRLEWNSVSNRQCQDNASHYNTYLYCLALSMYSCCSMACDSIAATSITLLQSEKKIIGDRKENASFSCRYLAVSWRI